MTPTRIVTIAIAGVAALSWWATPGVEPHPPDATTVTQAPPHATPAPFVLEAPAPALITEPPTRSDGLDRFDPCAPVAAEGPPRTFSFTLLPYARRRSEALEPALRAAMAADLAGRLGASAPPADLDAQTRHLATWTLLALGAAGNDDATAMRIYAQQAITAAPGDALGYALLEHAAQLLRDDALERAAIHGALAAAPRDIEITHFAALHFGWSSDVMAALHAADLALDVASDPDIRWLRAHFAARAHAFADGARRSRGRFTIVGSASLDEASVDRLLGLAERAAEHVRAMHGSAGTHETTVYVFGDDASRRSATCLSNGTVASIGSLSLTQRELDGDGTEERLYGQFLRIALDDATRATPAWLVDALLAHDQADEEDGGAYRALGRRHAWIPPSELPRAVRDGVDARLARGEARAIIEWLLADRDQPIVPDLAHGGLGWYRDPLSELSRVAGTQLDEPTLLAFIAARVDSAPRR